MRATSTATVATSVKHTNARISKPLQLCLFLFGCPETAAATGAHAGRHLHKHQAIRCDSMMWARWNGGGTLVMGLSAIPIPTAKPMRVEYACYAMERISDVAMENYDDDDDDNGKDLNRMLALLTSAAAHTVISYACVSVCVRSAYLLYRMCSTRTGRGREDIEVGKQLFEHLQQCHTSCTTSELTLNDNPNE